MKFKEFFGSIKKFSKEQMDAREVRLQDPDRIASLDSTESLVREDVHKACKYGLMALWRFSLGAPLNALSEGAKEFGGTISHNMSVKDKKDKKSYSDIPATVVTEAFAQYGKGSIDIVKMVGCLGVALGRATVLGGRYLIGK